MAGASFWASSEPHGIEVLLVKGIPENRPNTLLLENTPSALPPTHGAEAWRAALGLPK